MTGMSYVNRSIWAFLETGREEQLNHWTNLSYRLIVPYSPPLIHPHIFILKQNIIAFLPVDCLRYAQQTEENLQLWLCLQLPASSVNNCIFLEGNLNKVMFLKRCLPEKKRLETDRSEVSVRAEGEHPNHLITTKDKNSRSNNRTISKL